MNSARFARQIVLPEIGEDGQKQFSESICLIIGVGGLGCAAALNICLSGVGRVILVDGDDVDITNLHRQILHTEASEGTNKALSGQEEIRRRCSFYQCSSMNEAEAIGCDLRALPAPSLVAIPCHLTVCLARALVPQCDVVADCTDSLDVRYLLGDLCARVPGPSGRRIPLVAGDALRWDGHLTTYCYGDGPCLRCVHPEPPPRTVVQRADQVGVFGPAVNVLATLQAAEVLKVLLGCPALSGKLLLFDAKDFSCRRITLRGRVSTCSFCSDVG
eukprot:gnl/Trimastix_PCT/2640.p1 GENE.gnl/Trimastix_PCT/2640~~gnl/Trimastix_PCT/2640.p1  ORF type:complete len:274 (-),score=16.78 gnl/Trimastix_PCT/2640:37-858(-)